MGVGVYLSYRVQGLGFRVRGFGFWVSMHLPAFGNAADHSGKVRTQTSRNLKPPVSALPLAPAKSSYEVHGYDQTRHCLVECRRRLLRTGWQTVHLRVCMLSSLPG